MEIRLVRANVNDAKELHAMQIESFKTWALRKKLFGYAKKYMEMMNGSCTPFCKNPKTVIYMRKWDIGGLVKQKS